MEKGKGITRCDEGAWNGSQRDMEAVPNGVFLQLLQVDVLYVANFLAAHRTSLFSIEPSRRATEPAIGAIATERLGSGRFDLVYRGADAPQADDPVDPAHENDHDEGHHDNRHHEQREQTALAVKPVLESDERHEGEDEGPEECR